MRSMEGEVVLITGAASGLGRAAANAFAARGASLALCDRDDEGGREVLAEVIRALGVPASFASCDVSNPSNVEGTVRAFVERFGRIDHAFNNAGIPGPSVPLNEYPEDAWDLVLRTNLTGVWLCMKHEIDHMLTTGHGTIVNTSSIAGTVAYQGGAAYIAAKHGVLGITKTAAVEYASRGIRVNAICPGYIATPMVLGYGGKETPKGTIESYVELHPIGRLGTPEEVADVVTWLCADAPDFISGHGLMIDGGYTAR